HHAGVDQFGGWLPEELALLDRCAIRHRESLGAELPGTRAAVSAWPSECRCTAWPSPRARSPALSTKRHFTACARPWLGELDLGVQVQNLDYEQGVGVA